MTSFAQLAFVGFHSLRIWLTPATIPAAARRRSQGERQRQDVAECPGNHPAGVSADAGVHFVTRSNLKNPARSEAGVPRSKAGLQKGATPAPRGDGLAAKKDCFFLPARGPLPRLTPGTSRRRNGPGFDHAALDSRRNGRRTTRQAKHPLPAAGLRFSRARCPSAMSRRELRFGSGAASRNIGEAGRRRQDERGEPGRIGTRLLLLLILLGASLRCRDQRNKRNS